MHRLVDPRFLVEFDVLKVQDSSLYLFASRQLLVLLIDQRFLEVLSVFSISGYLRVDRRLVFIKSLGHHYARLTVPINQSHILIKWWKLNSAPTGGGSGNLRYLLLESELILISLHNLGCRILFLADIEFLHVSIFSVNSTLVAVINDVLINRQLRLYEFLVARWWNPNMFTALL